MLSSDREGKDQLLIVIAAQFDLPDPRDRQGTLHPSEEQPLPPLADEYHGEPGKSSLRLEGQTTYRRPATDIYINGHACAPEGQVVKQMAVGVRVGPCLARLLISGDRIWEKSLLSVRPSEPQPFTRMPLRWERSFGGVAPGSTEEKPVYEARNPVGCGMVVDDDAAVDQPLPNIEDFAHPLTKPGERPPPAGLGPIARYWQPRVAYAGTYDDAWRRRRAPLWPDDFDEHFFCAAPAALQARPHLQGGDPVQLHGLHPGGVMSFELPKLRFSMRSHFRDRTLRVAPLLDGIHIDTDAMKLALYYRIAIPAPLDLVRHRETWLRLLEPWEPDVPVAA